MSEYPPDAIQWLFEEIHSEIPSALMGGIQGDEAHTYGYHRGRNYVSSSDYSVQLAEDKQGDGEACSALDISWNRAEDHYTVSRRLLDAKHDSRMHAARSFFGSTDGVDVIGWDYAGGYPVTSDPSHLWHVHLSILRKYANDYSALGSIADVIVGNGKDDDEMPEHVAVNKTQPVDLSAGEPRDLEFDEEVADTGDVFVDEGGRMLKLGKDGVAPYISTFSATVRGLDDGEVVHTAIVFCELDGTNTGQSSWLEHRSNGQALDLVDVRSYRAGGNRAIKIRVKSSGDAELAAAQWRVHFWR